MIVYNLIEQCFWFGIAACGFGILFNIPYRTIGYVFVIAFCACVTRNIMFELKFNQVFATFVGATVVGLLSIWSSEKKSSPPMIFSIPAVIPMVPGVYIQKLILGLVRMVEADVAHQSHNLLPETAQYALKASFILMAIALGVAFPMLISKSETAKDYFSSPSKKTSTKA